MLVLSEAVLVLSEAVLVLSEAVLVLSEAVLVLGRITSTSTSKILFSALSALFAVKQPLS